MPKGKINWRVYERDHVYPQVLSAYLDMLEWSRKNHPYLIKYYEVMSFADNYFWWARDIKPMEIRMRKLINDWTENQKKFDQFIGLFINSRRKINRELSELKKINLRKTSNSELYVIYRKARNLFLEHIDFSEYTVDLFDDFFGTIFAEFLNKKTRNKTEIADLGSIMRPAEISQSLSYKKELLQLSLATRENLSKIKKLEKEFNWIMMSWDGQHELTTEQIKKEISRLMKQGRTKREKEIEEINSFSRKIKIERLKLIKKYDLTAKNLKPYFYLLDRFVFLHDGRKEAQMKCNQIIFRSLKEMSRRFKINYNEILFYFNQEIKDLCLSGTKLTNSELKKRKTGVTLLVKNEQLKRYVGPSAKKILNKLVISQLITAHRQEIRGLIANKGGAVGRVAVVKSAKEAAKILRPGGILVVSMTTVDYLPIMKRAGAVVTDDGGVTCHAAIVSRELGIPCIVGTKIATQVFKTGDKVEVDANKGIVKIIK